MGQITIYLDARIEKKIRKEAELKKVSNSKFIADILMEKFENNWPESIINLAGTWKDFPDAEEIRSSSGTDIKREDF
ncbi:MAG: CopG family transcriptional regulator [Thermodesulfobacteriota bacterium]